MTTTIRSPKYLVDYILPSREVHLIGGPSGSGKSTWVFQTLIDWSEGKHILGYESHPVPWVYVSTDRSVEGVERVFERMKIDPERIPFASTLGAESDQIGAHLDAGLKRVPNARLFVVEGMSGLVPESSRSQNGGYSTVRRFLGRLARLCHEGDITIIGVVHSPKMKEDSRYTNPRQRVMGSVAWAAYTETIFLVEEFKLDDPAHKDDRTLICLPRNAPSQYVNLRFQSGRLVAWEDELDEVFVEQFLIKNPEFTRATFYEAMAKYMSDSTAKRRLRDLEDCQRVIRVGHGQYKVGSVQ